LAVKAIAQAFFRAPGVTLLHVDVGQSANRTVYTLVGPPEAVVAALLEAASVAFRYLDMTRHQGNHPRIGALDVCPLVPLAGIDLEETVQFACQLAQELALRHSLPVYLYAAAAKDPKRRELADLRRGGYEGLAQRLADPLWQPDFGPASFQPKLGASIVGARPILIAYNLNLPGAQLPAAKALARRLRSLRQTDKRLVSVRFLGWYLDSHQMAQISTNLLDYPLMDPGQLYELVGIEAQRMGLKLGGSELVGLCPLAALLPPGAPVTNLPAVIERLGLDSLGPFDLELKIIEYNLRKKGRIHEVQSLGWDLPDQ